MAGVQMKELSDEQLAHEVLQAERQLASLQFQHAMSALENTAQLGRVRKSIARLETEARKRELEQGLAKDSLVQQHAKTIAEGEGAQVGQVDASGGFLSGIVDKLTGKN